MGHGPADFGLLGRPLHVWLDPVLDCLALEPKHKNMVAYFCDLEYANSGLETARWDSRNAARLASDLRDTGRALAAQQDVHIYGHDTVGWFGHARLRRYRWAAAAFMGCR